MLANGHEKDLQQGSTYSQRFLDRDLGIFLLWRRVRSSLTPFLLKVKKSGLLACRNFFVKNDNI